MRPASPPDPKRLAQLLADLDNGRVESRRQAESELEGLGDLAEPALRKALEGDPPLVLRQRVERLLDKLFMPTAGQMRDLTRGRAAGVDWSFGCAAGAPVPGRWSAGHSLDPSRPRRDRAADQTGGHALKRPRSFFEDLSHVTLSFVRPGPDRSSDSWPDPSLQVPRPRRMPRLFRLGLTSSSACAWRRKKYRPRLWPTMPSSSAG